MPGTIELPLLPVVATEAPEVLAPAPAAAPATEAAGLSWRPTAQEVVEDPVLAVFSDEAGTEIDQLEFLSIDEAYDYAASQENEVVRCDLYDQFAGVRGRHRVTYVRKSETGHWVPLLR